jgi:hypothetical protein
MGMKKVPSVGKDFLVDKNPEKSSAVWESRKLNFSKFP